MTPNYKCIVLSLIAIALSPASPAQVDDRKGGTRDGAVTGTVTYIDSAQVTAAFARGAVLFDGHGTNYMVHASRRDAAGLAEVHGTDTDIIYVLDGTATFVTGGTVIAPKTSAPDEIRGDGISGGEMRHLRKGDVIIVPAGTPHWFKEVAAAMTYYVVKVRGS